MALLGPAKLLQLAAAWASMAYGMYIYIYIYIYIIIYIYICVYKLEIMGILKQQASPFSVCFLIVIGFLYIYMYIRCG